MGRMKLEYIAECDNCGSEYEAIKGTCPNCRAEDQGRDQDEYLDEQDEQDEQPEPDDGPGNYYSDCMSGTLETI